MGRWWHYISANIQPLILSSLGAERAQILGERGGDIMQPRRRKKQGSASAERIQKAYSERNYEIEVIPPKEEFVFDQTNRTLRVAAYCRVSTEEESQESSYVLQVENYVEFIKKHDNWNS